MKRKHKKYSKPKRPFDKERIVEEEKIKKEFGLKNKKEIWKADSQIKKTREKAKKLISADIAEQEALFARLKRIGLNVNSIAEILSLDKKDYLKRRLQSVLVAKKLATTMKSARQLITHKNVLVDGKIVNSPSYVVPLELEDKITLKIKQKKAKPVEKVEEEKEEVETPKVEEKAEEPENKSVGEENDNK